MYFKKAYTTKADVFRYDLVVDVLTLFSIGVIYWEIIARLITGTYKRPYSEFKELKMDYQIILRVATKQLRPTLEVCRSLRFTVFPALGKQPSSCLRAY